MFSLKCVPYLKHSHEQKNVIMITFEADQL